MKTEVDRSLDTTIIDIIEGHRRSGDGLIAILQDVQERYGYLSQAALRAVSSGTGRPLTDVYGVATFYRSFNLEPVGRHQVAVCLGTACHVRGGDKVAEAFERCLGIRAGATTEDGEFTLRTVNCLGACALGPIVTVDGVYFSNVSSTRVPEIVQAVREGQTSVSSASETFALEAACPRCGRGLLDEAYPIDSYPSILVDAAVDGRAGKLRLSSVHGSGATESTFPVAADETLSLSCPHCRSQFPGVQTCPQCGATMAMLAVRTGAILHVCSRVSCPERMLVITAVGPYVRDEKAAVLTGGS